MAGSCDDLPKSNTVQEMSMTGDEPPSQFHLKEGRLVLTTESSQPVSIIDINLLSIDDDNEMQKLKLALSEDGCFQAVGHGISNSFLDKVREVAKQFYALPLEEKQKCSGTAHDDEGYGPDKIVSENQVLDWSTRLFLRVFPEHQKKSYLWPKYPDHFGEILHGYSVKLKQMIHTLFKAIAKSLNLEETTFLNLFGEDSVMKVRFNFYPSCSRPDQVLGLKPHSDGSGITVVLQDEQVEGLQIIKDGRWITVPVMPYAFMVNLGDQMQIMTNGVYKSPLHRVVTNTEKLRISVAMFSLPEPDKEIGPIDELVDDTRPRLYRNVKNYGAFNYECFQKGKVAVEEVKI
ncbi:hypothetical protein ACFE04_002339 [Oxalis oulophora]